MHPPRSIDSLAVFLCLGGLSNKVTLRALSLFLLGFCDSLKIAGTLVKYGGEGGI